MKSIVLALITIIGMSNSAPKGNVIDVAVRTPLECVPVTDRNGCLMDGCYNVSRFVNRNGSIWAVCKLSGTVNRVPIEEDCEVPVILRECTPSPFIGSAPQRDCCLMVSFGNCSIGRVDCSFDLDPADMSCTPADYPSDLLCSINTACRTIGIPRDQVVMLLNQLL